MNNTEMVDTDQKMRELIILFLLANANKKISVLHIEKEAFLLQNFDKDFRELLDFIPYYKGPFSKEIVESIKEPMILINNWKFSNPSRGDNLSGGYVEITDKGRDKYSEIENKVKKEKNDKFLHLLTAVQIIVQLYNKLSLNELLLLIYDTYPEFTQKSRIYDEIFSKREKISKKLFDNNLIDEERYKLLRKEL